MELINLSGDIIGVVSASELEDNYDGKLVKEVITKKPADALKMVKLEEKVLDIDFSELSIRDKNKVILASKLQDSVIKLVNFSKGMTKKDLDYFKKLFKKIATYNRRIILVDKNSEMFLDCAQVIYVVKDNDIVLETRDIYDKELSSYIDVPKIVEFTRVSESHGVKINQYRDLDELLKAIYRIKS